MSSWSRGKASSASSCTEESALTVTDPLLTLKPVVTEDSDHRLALEAPCRVARGQGGYQKAAGQGGHGPPAHIGQPLEEHLGRTEPQAGGPSIPGIATGTAPAPTRPLRCVAFTCVGEANVKDICGAPDTDTASA
ncbi:hypothetical protein CRUP_002454 [Coryphaenoides rupestris]|nr:hypothetical protein CRUP_002454 [Coryphaenoides rupestris]